MNQREPTYLKMKENKEFNNSWAIILGGSSGLGLASARKLAAHGMNICILHRDRKINLPEFTIAVNKMKHEGIQILSFNKDARQPETIKEVIASLPTKSVKLLLHSIAKGSVKPMFSSEDELLNNEDLEITINAMGTSWYHWTQALIKNKTFAVNARNIAFTSEGSSRVWRGYGAVSAAKATLEALMRQMAVELAPLGITSNCVQAGATKTPSFEMIPGSEELAVFAKKRSPFNRLTMPVDVANVVYLLCKKEASWINGTVIKVDGGESLQ
jgi:NAD(P)-dependent dehydrogenase (short-subunit alcohol dehydrogenase family)